MFVGLNEKTKQKNKKARYHYYGRLPKFEKSHDPLPLTYRLLLIGV